jgi:uncharacterized membrane protein YphA (DoxX/SURF4 family)
LGFELPVCRTADNFFLKIRLALHLKCNIMTKTIINWILRIVASAIMLMTLYFKFTAHPQSVKLFTILGMEPWGRIGTGVCELIASLLILIPRTTLLGAFMGLGLMTGAIFFHLTKLGIIFEGDAGLFTYAVIAFVCCLSLIIIYRKNIPQLLKFKI